MKKRYNAIDLAKFIMAIVVVAIHTHPLEYCSNQYILALYNNITLAVPFFFLTSGFLLGKKMTSEPFSIASNGLIMDYVKKTVRLYLKWIILYFPLTIIDYWITGYSMKSGVLYYIIHLVTKGDHHWSGQLWYLLSMIYALLFVWLLIRCKFHPYAIIGLCFGLALLVPQGCMWITGNIDRGGAWYYAAEAVRLGLYSNGRIFRGFLYVPLGIILSHQDIPFKYGLAGFILGFLYNLFMPVQTLTTSVCASGLLIALVHVELKDSKIYSLFRQLSMTFYFSHMWIWVLFCYAVYGETRLNSEVFFAVLSLSFIVGVTEYCITQKHKKCKTA